MLLLIWGCIYLVPSEVHKWCDVMVITLKLLRRAVELTAWSNFIKLPSTPHLPDSIYIVHRIIQLQSHLQMPIVFPLFLFKLLIDHIPSVFAISTSYTTCITCVRATAFILNKFTISVLNLIWKVCVSSLFLLLPRGQKKSINRFKHS